MWPCRLAMPPQDILPFGIAMSAANSDGATETLAKAIATPLLRLLGLVGNCYQAFVAAPSARIPFHLSLPDLEDHCVCPFLRVVAQHLINALDRFIRKTLQLCYFLFKAARLDRVFSFGDPRHALSRVQQRARNAAANLSSNSCNCKHIDS